MRVLHWVFVIDRVSEQNVSRRVTPTRYQREDTDVRVWRWSGRARFVKVRVKHWIW